MSDGLRKRNLELKQHGVKLVMKRDVLSQDWELLPNNGTA